jgi:hypothetical protein
LSTGTWIARGAEVLTSSRAVLLMGQTIVMVTHDPIAASHADRIAPADGRIVDDYPANGRPGVGAHEAVRGVSHMFRVIMRGLWARKPGNATARP